MEFFLKILFALILTSFIWGTLISSFGIRSLIILIVNPIMWVLLAYATKSITLVNRERF